MTTKTYSNDTVIGRLKRWAGEHPDRTWLRDRKGDEFTEWTWPMAKAEIEAVAAWMETEVGGPGLKCSILSRNRAHWMLADMAAIAAGNVVVPLFTTHDTRTAKYILEFSDVKLLFLGEAENWEKVKAILPAGTTVVALPGVDPGMECFRWDDILQEFHGKSPAHQGSPDELMTIVYTSGTTGMPKGVMQTHDSMLKPMERCKAAFSSRQHPRFLSYLPLAHMAERQLVWIQSLIYTGEVTFNESLPNLLRDMAECKPSYFFGAPRVWEQLQQGIIARFGSQAALDQALEQNAEEVGLSIRTALGLQDTDYLLTAAAPTPAALIHWWGRLGIELMEGFGQTEAMGLIANSDSARRIGSIGKPIGDVEVRILESGELICKGAGLASGYYREPEKTAETFVDGWVHTGDKARVDEDGYYYITGRVKDYFKTIKGKFVAPVPIENAFAANRWTEQLCLLGRGYSKTVMVCVLSERGQQQERSAVEALLREQAGKVNAELEKHAHIGAVITTNEHWTIENGLLTPTMKIKRDEIEARFGEQAQALALEAAQRHEVLVMSESGNDFPEG